MKIVVRLRMCGKDDPEPWRAAFSGLFTPAGYAYGVTPDEAVRKLLKEAHTLVYRVPRSALRQTVHRLPPPQET